MGWLAPSSLPQLIFEGTWGSTTYLDIALDAVSIRRGSCNRGEPPSCLLSLLTLYVGAQVAGLAQGP